MLAEETVNHNIAAPECNHRREHITITVGRCLIIHKLTSLEVPSFHDRAYDSGNSAEHKLKQMTKISDKDEEMTSLFHFVIRDLTTI